MSSVNNEPAFPCECSFYDGNVSGKQTGTCHGIATGLTKREYFAAMAMQGIITRTSLDEFDLAQRALQYADALLVELAKVRVQA